MPETIVNPSSTELAVLSKLNQADVLGEAHMSLAERRIAKRCSRSGWATRVKRGWQCSPAGRVHVLESETR